MGEVLHHQRFYDDRAFREIVQLQEDRLLKKYEGDMKRFGMYCEKQGRPLNYQSVAAYMTHTILNERRKQSTFDRRLAAIKKHLGIIYNIHPTTEDLKGLRALRRYYNEDDFARLKAMVGQPREDKPELMQFIDERLDVRMKAIALVNLITANRPSEMTRLQIHDFDLKSRTVLVHLKKQGEVKRKHLTMEVVQAIRAYIKEYDLTGDDYFVAKLTKHGTVIPGKMTEVGYNKLIQKHLNFAPYTFRKTQITSMHENGASLPLIAKQSGHKSLQTITDHYLDLSDAEIVKYL